MLDSLPFELIQLIPPHRRLHLCWQRTLIDSASSSHILLFGCLHCLRRFHGPDHTQSQHLSRSQKPFMSQHTARLSRHLPSMAHIADTTRCHILISRRHCIPHISHVRRARGILMWSCRIGMNLRIKRPFKNLRQPLCSIIRLNLSPNRSQCIRIIGV